MTKGKRKSDVKNFLQSLIRPSLYFTKKKKIIHYSGVFRIINTGSLPLVDPRPFTAFTSLHLASPFTRGAA